LSNWDGLGDATSSIQLQRGLSATTLTTPSVGGTMNIISDPTSQKFGVNFKQEFGNDGFIKTSLGASSGKMGKLAVNFNAVKKTGNGLIDKTWTDAWAYYLGLSYEINNKNRIEFYAIGAPQRHGQNLYRQNAATYDQTFAKDVLGYTDAQLAKVSEQGRRFNQNWGAVSSSYTGKQWGGNSEIDRYDSGFIMERENFFHKPIVNLNWYSQLSKKFSVYTTAYWSGGEGGGTGTYGSVKRDFSNSPWNWEWDKTIDANRKNTDSLGNDLGSKGILRNSRNNQWTVGVISKAFWKLSDNFKTSFGIDWRKAEIDHFREVRDLLGGSYFTYTGNDFDTPESQKKKLGDKIAYNFTNTVDWFGAYLQGEYSKDRITAYSTVGWSMIAYGYTNNFKDDGNGNKFTSESGWVNGYQIKGEMVQLHQILIMKNSSLLRQEQTISSSIINLILMLMFTTQHGTIELIKFLFKTKKEMMTL